jgi:hypothetical protein
MPFDSDPRDEIESFQCYCGGEIILKDGYALCDSCTFKVKINDVELKINNIEDIL